MKRVSSISDCIGATKKSKTDFLEPEPPSAKEDLSVPKDSFAAVFSRAGGRAERYDDIYRVTIEKLKSFHIMLYRLFHCVANHSLYGNIWTSLCPYGKKIMKMEEYNSYRYNLHLQRHGPNLHGPEIGVS